MKTLSVVTAALALAVAASLAPTIAQEPKLPDDTAWPGISQRVDSGLHGYDHHARWRGHWVLVR